ncbi:MAG: hypothetical protein QF595_02760 [Dehalococcoidia bacterium]|nr:hypothetical protein [Dehalococcoidia bacterium]
MDSKAGDSRVDLETVGGYPHARGQLAGEGRGWNIWEKLDSISLL